MSARRLQTGQTVYTMRSNAVVEMKVIGYQHTETPDRQDDAYMCRDTEDGLVRWLQDGELHTSRADLVASL